jgi:hypothetical protein
MIPTTRPARFMASRPPSSGIAFVAPHLVQVGGLVAAALEFAASVKFFHRS